MEENKRKNVSYHILPASATLIGFCFVVLTSLKILDIGKKTLIDEVTLFATFLFLLSSLLSYFSIRTYGERSFIYEKVADIIFIFGLVFLCVITLLFAFNVMK
jgi:hypothetical protein